MANMRAAPALDIATGISAFERATLERRSDPALGPQGLAAPTTAPGPRALPEDGSATIRAMHMVCADDLDRAFVEQMALVARSEGFRLVVQVPAGQQYQDLGQKYPDVISLAPLRGMQQAGVDFTAWTEDQGEVAPDRLDASGHLRPGEVAISAPLKGLDIRKLMEDGRAQRLSQHLHVEPWEVSFQAMLIPMQGSVWESSADLLMAARAVATERPLSERLTYLEGGNVLMGKKPDGGLYALVGRDSQVISQAVLERDLGRKVSADEVTEAVARDLGVAAADVHWIEQPGAFHLDMGMLFARPGVVILNDARASARQLKEHLEKTHESSRPEPPPASADAAAKADYQKRLKKWEDELVSARFDIKMWCDCVLPFEDLAAAELQQIPGLSVVRLAGVFPKTKISPPANFLNGERGKGANGTEFFVGLGGDPALQDAFAAELKKLNPGLHTYFLPPELTAKTLEKKGGIGCRCKAEGSL
ncbi:MAG: hypothetical protein JXR83_17315 [Deltaproteobacteria bacterium]|nr:hypothetical protein [Deltaproteobacteria bacterium]